MNLTDQLAAALRAMLDDSCIRASRATDPVKAIGRAALAAYEACPKGEVKSNREWREECQQLRAIIERLALIPADDFYKTGDYAAGLVCDAWREARDIGVKHDR